VEVAPRKPHLTQLFDNDVLARLERLRLNPARRLTNRSHGEHFAGKGGTSTEFSDYRNYVAGDDVRFVDWNIFSRLHRPYMKLYRYEEEMHVVILLDASSSMLFDGKFEIAKKLAAALGVMGLLNLERVSLYAFQHADAEPLLFPPSTGRRRLRSLFSFVEGIEGGGDFFIDDAVEAVLRRHRGRGIAVVVSDFHTFGRLERPLNLLFSAGLEVFALQVLSPGEIDPEIAGDLRLVDCETRQTLDISSAADLIGIYREQRIRFQEHLAAMCRKRSGRYLLVNSHERIESILFDVMRRQGWVR
jgi:uncharacterized protein (DUF58 family)